MAERTFEGGCHCGSLEFTFSSRSPPARWELTSCQCTFCHAHGAVGVSDTAGRVEFRYVHPEHLRRYRFGLRTADFLVCRECGVLVGAVILAGSGAYALCNVNAFKELPRTLKKLPKRVNYKSESMEERRRRQQRTWTPVVGPV